MAKKSRKNGFKLGVSILVAYSIVWVLLAISRMISAHFVYGREITLELFRNAMIAESFHAVIWLIIPSIIIFFFGKRILKKMRWG